MKSLYQWILLASSALLYGLALIMSPSWWWLSFICFAPLFYLGSQQNLTFKEGFFYCALLWTLGGAGIIQTLYILGSGPFLIRILPSVSIVLIQALVGGFWFFGTSLFLTKIQIRSPYLRIGWWMVTTVLYFYWVIHLSLSMFDYWEGYFLLYPLLPLAEYPAALSWMPLLGKGPLMWLLLGTNAAMTIPFITDTTIIRWGAPLLGTLPWVIQAVSAPERKNPPAWVDRVAAIHKKFVSVPTPMDAAQEIQKDIKKILSRYPQVEVVLFPESSLYKLNLDTSRELATYWNSTELGKPLSLVIGASKWEEATNRNTLYWVYDGIVQGSFNKRHAMAVTETIGWYRIPFLKKLFHEDNDLVQASTNPRMPFPLLPEVSFIPYICSELFFNDTPDDHYPQAIITELANDYWAKSTYIRHLMFLSARFKAIEWQRPIIYVSFYHNGFLDTEGTITPLHR